MESKTAFVNWGKAVVIGLVALMPVRVEAETFFTLQQCVIQYNVLVDFYNLCIDDRDDNLDLANECIAAFGQCNEQTRVAQTQWDYYYQVAQIQGAQIVKLARQVKTLKKQLRSR